MSGTPRQTALETAAELPSLRRGSVPARSPGSPGAVAAIDAVDAVGRALERGIEFLAASQDEEGLWEAELEGNISLSTETMLLYRALGLERPAQVAGFGRYLRRQQRPDGTFALFSGGPPDLSMTVEGYWGLKLAGENPASPALTRARDWVLAHGGAQSARVLTRLYLALFGQSSHEGLPHLPPVVMLLPLWSRLSIQELSIWARGTLVAYLLLQERRQVFPLPPGLGIGELFARDPEGRAAAPARSPRGLLERVLLALERCVRATDRLTPPPLRRRALRAAEQWVLEHQEPHYPAIWMSILALYAGGRGVDHPVVAREIAHLESLQHAVPERGELRQMATESTIWDTALSARAMLEAGAGEGHPRHAQVIRACEALLRKQCRTPGDWRFKARRGTLPGGWAFESTNRTYPDVDTTSECLLLLQQVHLGDHEEERQHACGLGRQWLRGLQNHDGSWGTFDRDNTSPVFGRISFNDMGVFTDPRWPDTTGRQLEAFGASGAGLRDPEVARAVRWLRRAQSPDGSFFGRWATCFLFGTSQVLRGLAAVGCDMDESWVRRAFAFLAAAQNGDGGFGESNESVSRLRYVPLGRSTASQTAWGLLGLLAAAGPASAGQHQAARWLYESQDPRGFWAEADFTGGGLKGSWLLRYPLYPVHYPLLALAAYRRRLHAGQG